MMKAMIFAAGLGTRLRPVTDSIPKALVPVGGVPMLERVIRKLQAYGFDDFVVNVHHFASKVSDFIGSNESFGAHVEISVEADAPLETGGGIRHAAPLLRGSGEGRFLVHNVDILSNLDVRDFIAADDAESLATLLVADVPSDRYLLFDSGMRLTGWTNVRTGEVKSPYPDFDPSGYRKLSFCGIHIMSERIFALMSEWPDKFSIIDFYLAHAATERICGVLRPGLRFIDIGSPEKLEYASNHLDDYAGIV